MEQILDLPLSVLRKSPYQPRLRTSTKADVAELMELLKAAGQTTPIVVERCSDDPTVYWVHQGERRWTAAGYLGWASLKAYVPTGLTPITARKMALADNLGRRDLTAFEKTKALIDYQRVGDLDLEAAAAQLGLGRSAAFEIKAIWQASDALKDVFAQSTMPVHAAYLLARFERVTDTKAAMRKAKALTNDALTATELENLLKGAKQSSSNTRPVPARKDVDVKSTPTNYRLNLCWARHSPTTESKQRILHAIKDMLTNMGVTSEEAAQLFGS